MIKVLLSTIIALLLAITVSLWIHKGDAGTLFASKTATPASASTPTPVDRSSREARIAEDGPLVAQVLFQELEKANSLRAIQYDGWTNVEGPFNLLGTSTNRQQIKLYISSQKNGVWYSVDCNMLDNGGGVCFHASRIYTGLARW